VQVHLGAYPQAQQAVAWTSAVSMGLPIVIAEWSVGIFQREVRC
jgi:hypothetical protein